MLVFFLTVIQLYFHDFLEILRLFRRRHDRSRNVAVLLSNDDSSTTSFSYYYIFLFSYFLTLASNFIFTLYPHNRHFSHNIVTVTPAVRLSVVRLLWLDSSTTFFLTMIFVIIFFLSLARILCRIKTHQHLNRKPVFCHTISFLWHHERKTDS